MKFLKKQIQEIIKEEYYKILEDANPCWKGYEMIGMKKKGGKQVPNCVPISEEYDVGDAKGGTMRIRKNNPKARKSFRARHNCDNPGPRHKARYWSCRKW